jgi:hypothetical protein
MTAIRGRLGQFKVLSQQQQLIPHLVPTVHFTKSLLLKMLIQYDELILKPIVGRNFFKIEKRMNGFLLLLNETELFMSNGEAIVDFVQKTMPNQHFVLQPVTPSNWFWKKPFHFLLTLRRNGTEWEMTTFTKSTKHFPPKFLYYLYLFNIKKIALLAAKTLSSAYPICEAIVLDISCSLIGDIHIHDSFLHFSVSKWNQYQALKPYTPKTELLTNATLPSYIQNFKTVFIKPCNGQHGKGIVKISYSRGDCFEIQIGRTSRQWIGMTQCTIHLQQLLSSEKDYVIQQGIPLAKIGTAVFDVRVLLQKLNNQWQVIGKAVKVAGDGYFITNAAQAILPFDEALKQSTVAAIHQGGLEKRIDQLCLLAVKALNPSYYEIGFDVGITNYGEIRIIEGNYRSDVSLFHQLDDQTIYKSILKNRRLVNQPRE